MILLLPRRAWVQNFILRTPPPSLCRTVSRIQGQTPDETLVACRMSRGVRGMSDKKGQVAQASRAQTHIATLSIGPKSKKLEVLPARFITPVLVVLTYSAGES